MNEERKIYLFNSMLFPERNRQQLQFFNDAEKGMRERDLEIVQISQGDERYKQMNVDSAAYTIILLGKDGTEKYRTREVFPVEKLFSLIDAMPMRQNEMKTNSET